jgi:dTDP-4-dehydrorhamnose 3,5-epimerase
LLSFHSFGRGAASAQRALCGGGKQGGDGVKDCAMQAQPLSLDGLVLITPQVHRDDRGFFIETFNGPRYQQAGVECKFVQDNHSRSHQGTVRGMHFQTAPGQAKLVRVVVGRIYDVAVDIRPDSPTFGRWQGVYLDAESHAQLFLPVGFAHGFCVVSDVAEVLYKVSTVYDVKTEAGFRYDDPEVGIVWPTDAPKVSRRDAEAPSFAALRHGLIAGQRAQA